MKMQPACSSCSISYCMCTKIFRPISHSLACWSWWGLGSGKHTGSKWDIKCLESWWLYFSELSHERLIVPWCSKRKSSEQCYWQSLDSCGLMSLKSSAPLSRSCVPVGRPGCACWSPGSCFQAGCIMILFCLPFLQWAHQFWSPFST